MSAFGADHFRVSGVRLLHIALSDHRARGLRSPHAARHHRRLNPVGRHVEIGVHTLTNMGAPNQLSMIREFTRLNVRRMSHSPGIVNQTSRSICSIHGQSGFSDF